MERVHYSFDEIQKILSRSITTHHGSIFLRPRVMRGGERTLKEGKEIIQGGEKTVELFTVHFRPKFGETEFELGIVPGPIRVNDAEGAPPNKPEFEYHSKNEVNMLVLLEKRRKLYNEAYQAYNFPEARQLEYPPVNARAYFAREPWPFPKMLSEDTFDHDKKNKYGKGTRIFLLEGINGKRFDDFARELESLSMNPKEKLLIMFMAFKRIYRVGSILALEGIYPRDFSHRNLLLSPFLDVYSIDHGEDYQGMPQSGGGNFQQFLDFQGKFLQKNQDLYVLNTVYTYFQNSVFEHHQIFERNYISKLADYDMFVYAALFGRDKLYTRLHSGDLGHDEYLHRLLQSDFLLGAEQRLSKKYATQSFRYALLQSYSSKEKFRAEQLSDNQIAAIQSEIWQAVSEELEKLDLPITP